MSLLEASTKGEYGLILMSALAEGDGVMSLKKIARQKGLPYYYLMRLAALLKEAKLISSRKGRGGGYCLAADPQEITIKKILEALEGPMTPAPCVGGERCVRAGDCFPARFWQHFSRKVDAILEGYTLADMTRKQAD